MATEINIRHDTNIIKSFREMPRSRCLPLDQLVYNHSKIDYVAQKVGST